MKNEALKLALEAAYLAGFNASGEGYNGEYPFQDHNAHPEQYAGWVRGRDNKLSAIKQALAAPVQPAPKNAGAAKMPCGAVVGNVYDAYEAGKKAAQPATVQEPVALEAVYETIINWDEGGGKRSRRELARRIVDLYITSPAAPVQVSPLAFVTMVMEKEHLVGKPLFWAEWPNKENT